MRRRPPRSTLDRSSAASDVYKRQVLASEDYAKRNGMRPRAKIRSMATYGAEPVIMLLSLIHISEPTRPY